MNRVEGQDVAIPITDERSDPTPLRLSRERLRALSQTNWLMTLGHIVGEWTFIAAAIALCEQFWHPILYVAAIIFIGARQHALAILMHDGAHLRLCGNRNWNNWLSDLFFAWPLFITTWAYRNNHFAHHRHVNTNSDPDWIRKQTSEWKFPKRPLALAFMLARDVVGLSAYKMIYVILVLSGFVGKTLGRNGNTSFYLGMRGIYYTAAGWLILHYGLGKMFLLYWFVPYCTWFVFVLHVRSIAEHFALPNNHTLNASRTTYATWLERVLLAPKNINYHIDHHLFPSVPFYRLPKLHAELCSQPSYATRAHITDTYLGVLRECVSGK